MQVIESKFLLKRGQRANLPTLEESEPALATDTKEIFVGSSDGNIQLAKQEYLDSLVINPKKFGAKGDGSDDTLAIQNTIDYVQGLGKGEVLLFGNHGVSSKIILKSGVSLRFVSGSQLSALTNTSVIELERNASLLGHAKIFTGGVVGYNKDAIYLDGTKHLSYRDINIEDMFCEGNYASGMGNAIHFDCSKIDSDISFVKVGRFVVRGFEKGVFFDAPPISSVEYNYANGNVFENIIISDCDYYIYGTGDHSANSKNAADGNIFINASFQYNVRAKEMVHLEGRNNKVNGFTWDTEGTPVQIVNLTATSKDNFVDLTGSDYSPDNYINNGTRNVIRLVDEFHDFVPMKDTLGSDPKWVYRYNGDYEDVLHKANVLHTITQVTGTGLIQSGSINDVFDGLTYKSLRLNLTGGATYSFEIAIQANKYTGYTNTYLYNGLKNLGFTFLYNRVPNQIILDITSDTGTVKTTTIDLIGKANRPAINIQRSSANGLSSHIAKIKVTLVGQQDTDVRLARMYANSFFTGGVKYLSNGGGVMAGDIDFNKFKAIRKVWDSGTTANRPINPAQYQEFFDTSIGKPIWYVGAVWKDAAGTTV